MFWTRLYLPAEKLEVRRPNLFEVAIVLKVAPVFSSVNMFQVKLGNWVSQHHGVQEDIPQNHWLSPTETQIFRTIWYIAREVGFVNDALTDCISPINVENVWRI